MSRSFLERPAVHRAEGYVPGEQPENAEVIKLNTNENPYPPSAAVQRALSEFDVATLRRYPTPTATEFRALAGHIHGVRPEQIVATNGGDELLRLVLATFVDPGETIATASPCYSLYEVIAAIHGAEVSAIDLEPDWSIPTDFAQRCNDCSARAAFVVNPHAPSGKLSDVDSLSRIATDLNGVLVIDEAYLDFIDPDITYASVRLTEEHDNVLILRTMSKGYSLAGLRFGYGIGSMPVIDPMQTKTKDSYNTDAISQALATAAMKDQDYARST
jgi:histidinol-phosphate aminotransferase